MMISGRFDFHVQLAAPATSERGAILKHEIQKRLLDCSEDILLDLAAKCEGYDAYDLVFRIFYIHLKFAVVPRPENIFERNVGRPWKPILSAISCYIYFFCSSLLFQFDLIIILSANLQCLSLNSLFPGNIG